jgi:hypothetical protein
MLLAIDLHEDFIDVEGVAVASVLSLQAPGVNGSKFDTPESNRFTADSYASLGQEILDIPVTEIESIVEPDCVGNDIWRKTMAFICIHPPILLKSAG